MDQWPTIYEKATGKPWTWTAKEKKAAGGILKISNIKTVEIMLKKYAENIYWSAKGCPLQKLLDNINEFQPTRDEIRLAERMAAPARPAPAYNMDAPAVDDGFIVEYQARQARAEAARAAGASPARIAAILWAGAA